MVYVVVSVVSMRWRKKGTGEPFGTARGPGFSPERYKVAEAYELSQSPESSRGGSPGRM